MTHFSTRAIHEGQEPDPATGAVSRPLHLSSTFRHDAVGQLRAGYEYTRSGNPTRSSLQDSLAGLEGGAVAYAVSSGMQAEDIVLRTFLRPGSHVLLGDDAYAGTHRLIAGILGPWGVTVDSVDLTDPDAVRAAVARKSPDLVWVETPTNPLLQVVDIAEIATITHESDALLVVDNTFATPYLQQPISLGADVVIHSLTKFLGGHSDVVGGAIVLADETHSETVYDLINSVGSGLAPFDCWLVSRGLKTLPVRMDRHEENAFAVCAALEASDLIAEVTRATRSRRPRCPASAAWSPSASPAARARPACSSSPRSCSRSPSRWAGSSPSSSTRRP
jgi:cystathionine gamma-synthase